MDARTNAAETATEAADALLRERLERAFREHVCCRDCGTEMVILMRRDVLRIECGRLVERRGIGYLLASSRHESHVVGLPADLLAAA